MTIELWTRKREIGDADENNMEDPSNFEKSGERLAYFGLTDFVSASLPTGLGPAPAVSVMVN